MPTELSGYAERKPLAVGETSAHRSVLRTTLSLIGRCVINIVLGQATEAGGHYIRALKCVYVCLVCVRREKGFYILVNQREVHSHVMSSHV